jgi:hypothetical protein
MKKTLLIAAAFLVTSLSYAQLNVNLIVSPNPPGSLLDWALKKETLTYVVANNTGAPARFIIKAELKLTDGTVIATNDLSRAKIITFTGNSIVLSAADVIPLETMMFTGKYKTSMDKTGKLPAGTYQLCVRPVNPGDYRILGEERCRTFTIASFQLPIPVMPANDDVLDAEKAQTAITFRWTPVTPAPATPVRYIVTVFEILDKQTPMQALRSNQPLLAKEVIGTTQFIWQPQLSFIRTKIWTEDSAGNKNKVEHWGDPHEYSNDKIVKDSMDVTRFIWTLQTFDATGQPFGDGNINGDGISEPNTFVVIKDRRKQKGGIPARTIYMNSTRGKTN